MDKTIAISLGGFSFTLDEGAYRALKKYLEEIRNSLGEVDGIDEIISDIEIRISELFKERLLGREVVNEADVAHVIDVMGRPEQFVDEDQEKESKKTHSQKSFTKEHVVKKKLYRDPDDKLIGGVFAGIAHYFNVEPWIIRIIGLGLLIADIPFTGSSSVVIIYIIFMVILPKAETASQKYEMFGESGDINTIKQNATTQKNHSRNGVNSFFDVLGRIIVIGLGILFISMGITFAATAVGLFSVSFITLPIELFESFVLGSSSQIWLSRVFGVILMIVPAILLIMGGARILSDRFKIGKTLLFSMVGMWFISLIGAGILAANVASNFKRKIATAEKTSFEVPQDTINLSFVKKDLNFKIKKWWLDIDTDDLMIVDNQLLYEIDRSVELRPSDNDELSVEVVYHSRGKSVNDAQHNADEIAYHYQMDDNGDLLLDNYLALPKGSKYRGQSVSLIVYVPENKIVYSKNVSSLVLTEEDSSHKNYKKGKKKYYQLIDGEFTCLNCKDTENDGVEVSRRGIHVKDGNDKVIINRDGIHVSDGEDTVEIGF